MMCAITSQTFVMGAVIMVENPMGWGLMPDNTGMHVN